ncbi:MAG: bifunctional riboflavin kinase/FAD synthetase [Bryobacterales bacterium]|nr:bifunctional riboflavin kinase/FAD synthetase [Bryobacterales bacterium]
MRVYRSLDEARNSFGPCALSIGNFDGVHVGHQALFAKVREVASARGLRSAVLTFSPHPTQVVAPHRAPKLLSTVEQRCQWIRQAGIDHVLILPFDQSLASKTPAEFVQHILVEALQVKAAFIGDNFRFGHKQAGDAALLEQLGAQYGFEASGVGTVNWRGHLISSSEIRRLIQSGSVMKAARMLGRCYALEGNVVRGHGIGSKQTVPTLNLSTQAEVLPAQGVYVTETECLTSARRWRSISNIGFRPTFDGDALSIETYLLDPLADPVPETIRVSFAHRLREERRFETSELLKLQIFRDVSRALAWHRRYSVLSPARYTGN